MCYLIHVGVPIAHAAAVKAQRAPRVERCRNASVEQAFGTAFALFSVADGGCSCRLYSSPATKSRPARRSDALRKKYVRMGWSEEKIARALSSSNDAMSTSQHDDSPGLGRAAAEYVADLAGRCSEIRFIVHDYRGLFAEEVVVPARTVRMSPDELRAGGHFRIETDTVYEIQQPGDSLRRS